ncbi:MAG: type III-B CRISPR-associated protein Cas10/Cmr2, partial [Verrucomicrobia bacterium]|nr:type III-B CRISPR-associated protein Cas10/Cmr2 [Verrucomicrobiota bacterium]
RVQTVVEMATRQMPLEHRDWRYYGGGNAGPKDKLNNIGLGWSVILAFNSWSLDAVRQTRHFNAANTGGWQIGTLNNKDALTGREEAVAGGDEWSRRATTAGAFWPSLFKKGDWLSAATLVKRVWHRAYLEKDWGLKTDKRGFPMPNTRGIAGHQPEEDCGDDETAEDAAPSEKYFAVLALDGDEIGKWVSGEKTPPFASQLADYQDGSDAQRFGAKPYFEKPEFGDFLEANRPLSPSYHLQFGEALSNFALLCARPIVEAFDGRLIYAGGDDVLALLPADTVMACAEALRLAFTGREVRALSREVLFHSPAPGFLSSDRWKDDHGRGRPIPFLVPGPAADASVGIAIAHFKSPLQDVVRAAQDAEKRAKKQLGRSAVAVTLFKRSGETIEWGVQWGSHGLEIYQRMAKALESGEVSSRFPYRVVALLERYLTEATALSAKSVQRVPDFDVASVIERELNHVIDRQGTSKEAKADLRREWLDPVGDPTHPSQLRRFLRWTVEQEARAAARKLAEKLSALAPGESDSPDIKTLRDLADRPIRDDSRHEQDFRVTEKKLAGAGGGSSSGREAAAKALKSFERRLPEAQLQALIGLCQTVAFANRTRGESANPQSTTPNPQSV